MQSHNLSDAARFMQCFCEDSNNLMPKRRWEFSKGIQNFGQITPILGTYFVSFLGIIIHQHQIFPLEGVRSKPWEI